MAVVALMAAWAGTASAQSRDELIHKLGANAGYAYSSWTAGGGYAVNADYLLRIADPYPSSLVAFDGGFLATLGYAGSSGSMAVVGSPKPDRLSAGYLTGRLYMLFGVKTKRLSLKIGSGAGYRRSAYSRKSEVAEYSVAKVAVNQLDYCVLSEFSCSLSSLLDVVVKVEGAIQADGKPAPLVVGGIVGLNVAQATVGVRFRLGARAEVHSSDW